MKNYLFILSLGLFLVACGGDDDGKKTSNVEDLTATDAVTDVAPADVPDEDLDQEPQIPVPANPLPTPEPGTYSWTDGINKISFAYNSGKIFVLEASFSCMGETGCKVIQDFLKLTCNKAFEKGYFAQMDAGAFVVEGIKGSDTLYGAVQDTQSFSLLYRLTPNLTCCENAFAFTATWDNTESCADYATPDCDPYTDENCPDGKNCIFGAGDKPACTLAGEVAIGEECSVQGNCADGVCMALEGDDGQHCYGYCKNANDCIYGAKCLELTDSPFKICSLGADAYETCHILQQNCEEAGDGCYWSSSTINQPVCLPAGAGGAGDACTTGTDCQKGYDCIAGKNCRKVCNLTEGQEPECDSVFTGCSNHYTPQNAGYCGE
jgi:hypothetical protein